MARKKIDGDFIRAEVERITGTKPDSYEFDYGCVMLCATQVGPNVRHISKFLNMERNKAAFLVSQLRRKGIFSTRKIRGADWFDKKTGGVAFNLDIAVAMGWLKKILGCSKALISLIEGRRKYGDR